MTESTKQPSKREPFLMLKRNKETEELLKKPDCFMLLTQIALRAKRNDDLSIHNLKIGESFIGDYKNIGLTERRYRTAKSDVQRYKLATFKATNRGTIAKLTGCSIYDINESKSDEPGDRLETGQRRADDEPGDRLETTNKKLRSKELEELKEVKNIKIPDFIKADLWNDFLKLRISLKAKNTDAAIKLLINKLTAFDDKGLDANEAIENSIENSWKGVFEPKPKTTGKSNNSVSDHNSRILQQFVNGGNNE